MYIVRVQTPVCGPVENSVSCAVTTDERRLGIPESKLRSTIDRYR
ncbi:MAG: hypothetical protein J07HX64_00026 [halophilic archaeon J07HX64]|nr:MAG: hypothetical protein J07HX64_00026 [halophilic archaeon J07HX64]